MHDLDRPSQRAHATRRGFLARMSGLGLAALAGLPPSLALASREGSAEEDDDGSPATRRRRAAYDVRHEAALRLLRRPLTSHPDNGDERRYPSRIGSYSKCLPHDARGEVAEAAYGAFLHALGSGRGTDFEAIPMGGTLKLANPQAAVLYPLHWPLLVLAPDRAQDVALVLHVAIAAVGAYAFARLALRTSPLAAVVAGAGFGKTMALEEALSR